METKIYSPKKKELLALLTLCSCQIYHQLHYSITVNNSEILRDFSKKPLVLLPKHQAITDLLLEGYLVLRNTGKCPYAPMKDSLPQILEYIGGIPIKRLKDIKSTTNREERKKLIQEAQEQKEFLEQAYTFHLSRNEPLIVHPEGERNYRRVGKINPSSLILLLNAQEKLSEQINFVPLDIFYEDIKRFRSKIVLKFGKPIQTSDLNVLVEHIIQEVRLLER